MFILNPSAKLQTKAYNVTSPSTNDYTTWKQTSSSWGEVTPWPNASIPKFGDAGCWVTSMAMILREYNIVKDSDVDYFNPIICNNQLMSCGVVNSAGDYDQLQNIALAYDGITYAGSCSYSFEQLKTLFDQGYACIIQEDGHYVAVQNVTSDNVIVMDPGYDRISLVNPIAIQFYHINYVQEHNVIGCVWNAQGKKDKLVISGWAFDEEDLELCTTIHIYLGNPKLSHTPCYTVRADQIKGVNNVRLSYPVYIGNYHRFDTVIPIYGVYGAHVIWIYAENGIGEDEDKLLEVRRINLSQNTDVEAISLRASFIQKEEVHEHAVALSNVSS